MIVADIIPALIAFTTLPISRFGTAPVVLEAQRVGSRFPFASTDRVGADRVPGVVLRTQLVVIRHWAAALCVHPLAVNDCLSIAFPFNIACTVGTIVDRLLDKSIDYTLADFAPKLDRFGRLLALLANSAVIDYPVRTFACVAGIGTAVSRSVDQAQTLCASKDHILFVWVRLAITVTDTLAHSTFGLGCM